MNSAPVKNSKAHSKLSVAFLSLALATSMLFSGPDSASARDSFGVRGGFGSGPDQIIIGGMIELGKPMGTATVVPSLDLGLGDNATVWAANLDLRWYLLPLPESGVKFYGAAGPTIAAVSAGKGGSSTEIGLSLTAGARIPMRNKRRYNLEARFGFGDIPDFKLILGILF